MTSHSEKIVSILLASKISTLYTPSDLADGRTMLQLIFEFDPENPESRAAWTEVCTLLAEELENGI